MVSRVTVIFQCLRENVRFKRSNIKHVTHCITHSCQCTLKNYEYTSYYSLLSSNVTVIIECHCCHRMLRNSKLTLHARTQVRFLYDPVPKFISTCKRLDDLNYLFRIIIYRNSQVRAHSLRNSVWNVVRMLFTWRLLVKSRGLRLNMMWYVVSLYHSNTNVLKYQYSNTGTFTL